MKAKALQALHVVTVAALGFTLCLTLFALVPQMFAESFDSASSSRVWLVSAYIFFAFATPITGLVSLCAHIIARPAAGAGRVNPAPLVVGAVAIVSATAWVLLFPYVFFAAGGSR